MEPLKVSTYNIHKGMSVLNRHVRVEDMAKALDSLSSDVMFLQEVQGKNLLRTLSHHEWPRIPQHQYLARQLGRKAAYGLNASYGHGHHGNAVLTRFPIASWCNLDISVNRFESRGVLHCVLEPPGWSTPVIALCAHLNLRAGDRRKQYATLARYIRDNVPPHYPLILAGDFNDWRGEATDRLLAENGLHEVFQHLFGQHARSFPSRLPLLTLDRIYVRGLRPVNAKAHHGAPWNGLSDHLPLSAELLPV
ncbi:endonuclease/exonuclease/phosphatase [Pseudogulbenkiania sp. NH8B]|uniref:endonuclease/exonuclease/phosphatase family protein n=1 Tax=Pseudogulbenkiania sp. (strain NH8B) TaxID=748280 RepID=UPI0002279F9E|nr:endonuclease/exonuclease/phosphatase family protein [Pseudogulbenkiania sp. NH8B]BAK77846.1 endonuclease/exonuclease/phosphatase [Pseudogulbenkiania sp. NH8B]